MDRRPRQGRPLPARPLAQPLARPLAQPLARPPARLPARPPALLPRSSPAQEPRHHPHTCTCLRGTRLRHTRPHTTWPRSRRQRCCRRWRSPSVSPRAPMASCPGEGGSRPPGAPALGRDF
eukprot:scaffold100635_cov47-Phaeocystis_antarctica.AAC.1